MKRIRLLQTGDLHVGRGRNTWGEEASLRRAARLFDSLYSIAAAEKCHAVLICGDIFDVKAVSNGEREVVAGKLARYAGKGGIPTYIISGNHDLTTHGGSNLDFLTVICEAGEIENLHVAPAAAPRVWTLGDTGLRILGAPVGISEVEAEVLRVCADLDQDYQYVFMGHGTVQGSIRNDSNWRPTDKEDASRLSLTQAATRHPEVIYWAYGDIHKRCKRLPTLPEGAHGAYAGSPIQMDFGEQPDRGVLVVAFDCVADKWSYKGQRYVRVDTPEAGFEPLITIHDDAQVKDIPPNAFIRLAKDVVLSSALREQVVKSCKVVADASLPAQKDAQPLQLEVFDPLLADLSSVEREVLSGLPASDELMVEAKKVVGFAIERFRNRSYLS